MIFTQAKGADPRPPAKAYDVATVAMNGCFARPNFDKAGGIIDYTQIQKEQPPPAAIFRGQKAQKGRSSKYKGVHRQKNRAKWRARIQVPGKKIYLGSFECEREAALAYDAATLEYRGRNYRMNFPIEE